MFKILCRNKLLAEINEFFLLNPHEKNAQRLKESRENK